MKESDPEFFYGMPPDKEKGLAKKSQYDMNDIANVEIKSPTLDIMRVSVEVINFLTRTMKGN